MALASRNMGRIEIISHPEPNTALVRWTDMHPSLRVEHVALGHQGSYYGILSWGGIEGIGVEVDLDDLDEGEARYLVSWLPR
jgi:hypothetical protein